MGPQCTEGVILHAVSYQNYDQILTLFTPEKGILKIFCKKGKKQWQRHTPLTKVEVTYREKKTEICACEEIRSVDSYLSLRKQFEHLEAACELLQTIYHSQWVGKAAPLIYHLMIYYLDKTPQVVDPKLLVASFKLKVLKHEGVLNFNLDSWQFGQFSEFERDLIRVLAYSQSFVQLTQLVLPADFKEKINTFFKNQI